MRDGNGAGRAALGLGPGQTAAITGNPCPEWACADVAIMAAGGISYGLSPTSPPSVLPLTFEEK